MKDNLLCTNEFCGWLGKKEDCRKKFRESSPGGDVEPYLVCPKCGSEELNELLELGANLLAPVPV